MKFLNECSVNLLRRKFRDIRKENVVKHRKTFHS